MHRGHLALAAAARRQGHLEKVIFLPAWRSPHKLAGPGPAPAADRLAMLRRATRRLAWAEVSSWEVDRGRLSYSWQAAEHFAAMQRADPSPAASRPLCWLLGADQWDHLETWARPARLAELLVFLVFPRDGIPILAKPGFVHHVIDVRHPASSTAVRAAARRGEPLAELVPAAVAEYIARHGLYA